MHYYPFNIADYRKDTGHLSPIEHYIYRSLLDWLYLDEQPITDDLNQILRKLRLSKENLTDVEQVLNEFFQHVEEGYTQERVEREINRYIKQQEAASRAGKASAKARKLKASERALNKRSTTEQPTKNQEPRTKNHSFRKPTVSEIEKYCSERRNGLDAKKIFDHYETSNWYRGKTKIKDWKACVRTWERGAENNNESVEVAL